ncbi:MAG: putative TPR repeat methyltransferase [Yoonia sp.]|jgi:predicted TPR repeat methyltransferase
MPDLKTIAFYDTAAKRYANLTSTDTPSDQLMAFMALLPPEGHVLDLGCGPARTSMHMRNAGFLPDPVDASQGMINLANETHQIGARMLTFNDVNMVDTYDGVWANFSLLHAPRADLPRILTALATALHSNGILHIALKTGTGEARDDINRLYTYLTVTELHDLLTTAGFAVIATVEGHEIGCAGTDDPFVAMRARKND